MRYTVLVNCNWLPRLILLLALVFAQALYAGHAMQHTNGGNLSDCSICLLASTDDELHPTTQIRITADTNTLIYPNQPVQACFSNKVRYTQQSRAPPVSLY